MDYNPADLLNPKAASKASPKRARRQTKSPAPAHRNLLNGTDLATRPQRNSASPAPASVNLDDAPAAGIASMIEKMHDVAQRPQKRRKLEDVEGEEHKNGASFNGGGGGIISEYLKGPESEHPEPPFTNGVRHHVDDSADSMDVSNGSLPTDHPVGNEDNHGEPSAHADVVELDGDDEAIQSQPKGTANDPLELDDEEDEAQPNGDSDLVCYGRLEGRVNLHCIPNTSSVNFRGVASWPRIKCSTLKIPGRYNHTIAVKDPLGKDVGSLDVRISAGLAPIMETSVLKLGVQCNIHPRKRKEYELPGRSCSESVQVSVVISGPRVHAANVGQFLGQKNLFLQDPVTLSRLPYVNPQAGTTNFTPEKVSAKYKTTTVTRTAEETQEDLANLFDSAMKNANDLEETNPPDIITTPMLPHQKQALTFLHNHEEPTRPILWGSTVLPNGKKVWRSIITDQETTAIPRLVRGGILADEMGLGKTLSLLSLVALTMDAAKSWAAGTAHRCKATLLVAPLSVASNWEEQLSTHFAPGSIQYVVYHGPNRRADPKAFLQAHVIITTYNIVSSELNSRNQRIQEATPFARYEFYRVVLDEGHQIRNESTVQSRACCQLKASRRWVLTGTPIQNQLSDFGTLLKFLGVPPFEDGSNFARHVLAPFKQADREILAKLRLLVGTITLRRGKDKIDLPERTDQIVKVKLTGDERTIYEAYQREGQNRLAALSRKQKLSGRSFAHVLRSILILRLLATGGKDLLNDQDLEALHGLSSSTAIDVDEEAEKPAITSRTAYEMLKLCQEAGADTCAACNRTLRPAPDAADESTVLGYILPCFQLLCADCAPGVRAQMGAEPRVTCPFCQEWMRATMVKLTQEGAEHEEELKAQLAANPRHAKMISRYTGPHSKTHVLIAHLLQTRAENQTLPADEPPVKSVVFSTWTTHLDLLQLALAEHGLRWARLDGKMNRAQRAAALRSLREDPAVELILVSIGAGGVGLNLTAASRVYMLNPQFNPQAEAQALDRVHRLGQPRPVVCTRLIVDESIEEGLVELQQRKRDLAELSLGKDKTSAETALEKLERLKALFK